MDKNQSFEDWWDTRGHHFFAPSLKAIVGIAFKDGWYRAEKARDKPTALQVLDDKLPEIQDSIKRRPNVNCANDPMTCRCWYHQGHIE